MRRPIKPVILVSELEMVARDRDIPIILKEVYKDIEAVTYKHIEGSGVQDAKIGNAVQADTQENLDGGVIARYVKFRDSELREALQFCLRDEDYTESENDILPMEGKLIYKLEVPEDFHDGMLRPLAEYIHRFLVWGALADWYNQFGMATQAQSYERNLNNLKDKIVSILRGKSIEKRPLQPFGPAEPFEKPKFPNL